MDLNERIARALGMKGVMVGWCTTSPDCGEWEYDPTAGDWPDGHAHHSSRQQMVVALRDYDNDEAECLTGEPHTDYCYSPVDDYAHSLDACLPVLADLEAKGWTAMLLVSGGTNVADMQHFNAVGKRDAVITKLGDSPAAVLAECLADALETEKSPD